MIKKTVFGVMLLTFCLFGCFSGASVADAIENRGAFVIDSFDVDINVRQDSVLDVSEQIDVSFSQRRHGIFRKIPVRYRDDQGFNYRMKLDVLSVQNEKGMNIPYDRSREGGDVVLKIGDPDREIIGRQVYVLKYRIHRGMRFFEDHDELYWNPIGTGWPTTIKNASSTVHFEKELILAEDDYVCYTGELGSRNRDCVVTINSSKAITFKPKNRTLNSYEGLTIGVNFPKRFIYEPSKGKYFLLFISDNWGFLIPIFLLVIMLPLWNRFGKEIDLKRATVVQYGPPDRLTPGEMGYLMKERYSTKFVAADIVNLAVKGYLSIREIESKSFISLEKIGKITGKVKFIVTIAFFGFIASFIMSLIKEGMSLVSLVPTVIFLGVFFTIVLVKFKRLSAKKFKSSAVDYELENKKEWGNANDLTVHEKRLLKGLFASKVLGKVKLSEKKKFYSHVQIASNKIDDQIKARGYFENSILNSKTLYIISGVVGGFIMFMIGSGTQRLDFFISAILTAVILIGFGIIMSKKTRKGAEAHLYAEGYQNYINIAERYRVKFQEQENVFEKNLAYAMVFGNVDKWAKAFDGMIDEEPSWYSSKSGITSFRATTFASNLSNGFAAAATAASVSPSSSSSGGSSGGGGGGGGGGSW